MSIVIYYIICAFLAAGVLIGISLMSKVKTSILGNGLSALFTAAAILLTLYQYQILSDAVLWGCMVAGLIIGLIGAYRVKMIDMPQTVALLNGFGGASSALVAIVTLLDKAQMNSFSLFTAGLALMIGMITLTGSLGAGGKLHQLIPQEPIIWKKHQFITTITLLLSVASIISLEFFPYGKSLYIVAVMICMLVSGFFGVAFSIRVGGADMPITISLLNSLSGVAGSIAGMAIYNPLLVAIGGIVGASGLLLTQIMCRAMNRTLADILLGCTSKVQNTKSNYSVTGTTTEDQKREQNKTSTVKAPENAATILSKARKVIIIPGYGMALAQAQSHVKQLADCLESNGADVLYAIHPVAGRMPGHMNVLLCEVDVPYERLHEMDDINPQFPDCDAVVIVGANDVVNPAANTAEGTPIYGMPVLNAVAAKHVIICNYDLKPGYAGVENSLYRKEEGVTILLGDAKESLTQILAALSRYSALTA